MSSVDERIVDLKFNNQQFEQGVATSLGTLDRLKKGLNLEASAKSLDGLKAAGRSFSLANVVENVQTVANRFSSLGIIGDQVLRRLTDSAINLGRNLLTAIPNQIIQGGKKRAQNLEQAKFQLEGLGVAWDDVSESISAAVQDTAYGLDAAAVVASQYVATGVQLGDDMTKALTAISGVAAMTNSSYEDTGRIFTTVAGNGRLMGDQLNQLASRGLNVAAALTKVGEFAGKSEAEIREMVSKGQISFKQFSDAMYEAFGAHAKEADKTFNGALSNVKASLSRMGAQFATPAYEELRKVLVALIPVLKDIEGYIKPVSKAFTELAESASSAATTFLGNLHEFLSGGIEKGAKETAKAAEELSKNDQDLEKVARDVINGVYGNGEARKKALEEANYSYEDVQSLVNKIIKGEATLSEATEKSTETTEENTEANDKQTKARERQRKKMDEITGLTEDLSDRTTRLNNITAGLGAALSIVGQFGSAVYTAIIQPLTSSAMSKAQGLLDRILAPLSDFGLYLVDLDKKLKGSDFFSKKITGFLDSFNKLKGMITGLSGVQKMVTAFERLKAVLGGIASAKLTSFTEWLHGLNANKGDFGSSALRAVLRTVQILSNLMGNAMNGISNMIERVGQIGKMVSGLSGVQRLATDLKGLFATIKSLASVKLSQFTMWLGTLGDKSVELGSGPLRIFLRAIQTVTNGLADFIEWIQAGMPAVDGFFGKIGSFLGKGFSGIVKGVSDLISSLTKSDFKVDTSSGILGFLSSLGKIAGVLGGGVLKALGNVFKTLPKIFNGGGLKVFSGILKHGLIGAILLNLAQLTDKIKRVTVSVGPLKAGFTSTFGVIQMTLKRFQKNIQAAELIKIAAAVAILAGSLVLLAAVEPGNLLAGVIALSMMMSELVGVMTAIDKLDLEKGNSLLKVATSMIGIAIAVGFLAGAAKKLSGLSIGELIKGLGGVGALMAGMVVMANNLKSKQQEIKKVAVAMILFAAGIRILSGAVIKLSGIGWEELAKGLVGVGALMAGIVGMTRFMGDAGNMVSVGVGMIAMAAAIHILTGAVNKLGKMDTDILKQGFGALAGALLLVAIALNMMPKDTLAIGAGLIALSIGLNLVAAAMKTIGSMSGDQLAVSLIGMAGAFLILGAAVAGFGLAPAKMAAVAGGLILMTIALNGIVIALKVLGSMSGDQIAASFIAMAGAFLILGVAAMALGAIAGPIAIAGGALVVFGAGCAVAGAGLLVFAAGIGAILSVLGAAAGALSGIFSVIINAVIEGGRMIIEAFQTGINETASWLSNGGTAKIAQAIVTLVGNVLKILVSLLFELPAYIIYYAAEAFWKVVKGIGAELKKIGPMLKRSLADIWDNIQLWWLQMMASNAADGGIIGQFLSWLGVDFEAEAAKVEARIAGRKEEAEQAAKEYTGGMKSGIESGSSGAAGAMRLGNLSIEEAAAALNLSPESLIRQIMNYYNGGTSAASRSGGGTEKVVKLSSGKVKKAAEDVDISSEPLKAGIAAVFQDGTEAAETEAPKTVSAVNKGIESVQKALEFANKNNGGDTDLGLAGVSVKIHEIEQGIEKTTPKLERKIFGVARIINAGLRHATESVEVPESTAEEAATGWLSSFATNFEDGAEETRDRITGSVQSAFDFDQLTNLANVGGSDIGMGLVDGTIEGLSDFSGATEKVEQMGSDLIDAGKTSLGEHSPSTEFAEIGRNVALGLANGIAQNQSPVKTAVTMLALGSISAFSSYQGQFLSAGKNAGGMYALGIFLQKSSAHSAGASLASSAKSGAGSVSLYSTGQNIVQGLINGMRSKLGTLRALAKSIGNIAATKPGEGAQEGSPSKITIKTGKHISEGLIVGMKSMSSKVALAGSKAGEAAARSLENPLSVVTDILGADFDYDPTIRPVLDLSDIQNGARSINGILGGYSVSAGLINSSVNGRVNVSNADVVAAINDLSNRMDNLPTGDSIAIGDIIYDDGSGIADAVRQLAAAARVQRRA